MPVCRCNNGYRERCKKIKVTLLIDCCKRAYAASDNPCVLLLAFRRAETHSSSFLSTRAPPYPFVYPLIPWPGYRSSLVGSRVEELRRGHETEQKSRAGGGKVKGHGTLGPHGVRHHAGVPEHVVRGRRRHHHLVAKGCGAGVLLLLSSCRCCRVVHVTPSFSRPGLLTRIGPKDSTGC